MIIKRKSIDIYPIIMLYVVSSHYFVVVQDFIYSVETILGQQVLLLQRFWLIEKKRSTNLLLILSLQNYSQTTHITNIANPRNENYCFLGANSYDRFNFPVHFHWLCQETIVSWKLSHCALGSLDGMHSRCQRCCPLCLKKTFILHFFVPHKIPAYNIINSIYTQ